MVCRVYMREVSPWVLSIVVVPTTTNSIIELDAVPLLFSLCDEPLLAWDLAKRKSPPSESVLDRRFLLMSPLNGEGDEEPSVEIPPGEWVSATRCLDVLRENYKPGSLTEVISDVDEKVITKAIVSTLYAAVQRGTVVDHAVVRSVLDEQCECGSLEVDGVAKGISTFCSHVNVNRNEELTSSYCGESKVQLKFTNILRGTFKQIPGLPYFFYTAQHKESDSRFPGKSMLAFFEGLFNDNHPRALDNTLLERRNSEEHSQDDRISNTGSLRRSDRQVDQSRSKNTRSEYEKLKIGDDKQGKSNVQSGRYPLFIYFMCSIEYPDKSMDTFPVTFLPTCVYEVLRESIHKPTEEFDIAKVAVRLDLYVVTRPIEKRGDLQDDNVTESDDESHSKRQIQFLDRMPKKERSVIGELLNRLNRLVELETVLMDSRNEPITKDTIMRISAYIDHEYCKEKALKSGQIETRSRYLPLVIQCDDAMNRLKDRMNGMLLEYCVLRRVENSNMFYCCRVEDIHAFERYARQMTNAGTKSDGSDGEELLRKDQLFDFWVILIIDDNIKLQFCQRENGRHYRIFELAWRKCRQTIRVINQELLLNRMFELRECDPLLMTNVNDSLHDNSFDRSTTSSMSEDHEVDTHIAYGARFMFAPGYFACPLQEKLW
ncbi:putative phage head-tail adaptor [Dictyocaulus viviparus]|uniref:Putative phage head-tail adaptor n=1 Tax=Dictyocaulus viviparus TaxID=29172 RepID=A0A0D8Y393_DICVI|nr:putative phage head-tail adaptor [Dictyocaulus viviparus]